MKKPIIFISGGIWQKPFVEYLKNKNHFVAIVNPVSNDTTALCDLHIKCDINNIKEIEKYIKKINPIFITSDQSDVSTKIVSILSKKYNLPCNNPSVIEKFSNKYEIYKFAKKIKTPVPPTCVVKNKKDIEKFAKEHLYPVIIKPVDSTMSRGFRKINSNCDIKEEVFLQSLKFSKSKKIIAQKFIPGNMVTCEGVCSGGKHKTLATSIKIENEYFKPGITSKVSYPAQCDKSILKKIIEANDSYVEKSGMMFGLTHSEYLIDDYNFYLLEIGARGGGAGISSHITPWVSGVNSYDIFYQSLMGKNYDVKSIKTLDRIALLRYYEKKDVTKKESERIKKIKGVALFYYNFLGTQYTTDANDCRYSMGIFLAVDEVAMKKLENKINNIIK